MSICIPTFNRAAALDNKLAELAREIEPVKDDVEVCVSDNGSTDGTRAVLKKWEKTLPLAHSRNDMNLGFDRNVLAVTSLASGEYVWYLADDDRMVEGAIGRLVADLKANGSAELGAVYLNTILKGRWIVKCAFREFRIFDKKEMPIRPNISFLGSICVRRKLAVEAIGRTKVIDGRVYKTDLGDFALHDFAHTYLFLECLSNSRFVGVAPDYGVRIMPAEKVLTYRKKIYFEIILMKLMLEIRKYYPWFNALEAGHDNPVNVIGRVIIFSAFTAEEPDLEKPYLTFHRILCKLMEIEGRTGERIILEAYGKIRKLFFIRWLVRIGNRILRMTVLNPLKKEAGPEAWLDSSMEYALASTDRLLHDMDAPHERGGG